MRGEGMNGRESAPTGQRPRITVVIPCLNEEQGLPRVLKAIPAEVEEILVLDNCSTDRTVEVASDGDDRVRVQPAPRRCRRDKIPVPVDDIDMAGITTFLCRHRRLANAHRMLSS